MGCNVSRIQGDEDLLMATESAMTLGKRRHTMSRKDNDQMVHPEQALQEEIHGAMVEDHVEEAQVVLSTAQGKKETSYCDSCDGIVTKKRRSTLLVDDEDKGRIFVARDHNAHLEHHGDEEDFGSPSFRIYFLDNPLHALGSSSDKTSTSHDSEIVATVCRKKALEDQESMVTINHEESEPKAETKVAKPRRFGSLAKRRSIYAILKSRYSSSVRSNSTPMHATNST